MRIEKEDVLFIAGFLGKFDVLAGLVVAPFILAGLMTPLAFLQYGGCITLINVGVAALMGGIIAIL